MAKQQDKSNPMSYRDEDEQEKSKNPDQSYEGSSGSMFGNRESSKSDPDRDTETDRESTEEVSRTTGNRTEREH